MSLSTLIPFLFVGVPVILFLVVNVLLWRNRKERWREAASLMNAQYGGEGWLRCGTIQGRRNGRAFKIEVRLIGGAGRGKHPSTWITAPLLNSGLELFLPSAFFERGCDPAEASKRITFMEDVRVFVTKVRMERVRTEALVPQEQAQLAKALEGWNPALSDAGNPVGRQSVIVRPGEIVFSRNGVITDVRRLQALADLVTELARRIEGNPVEGQT